MQVLSVNTALPDLITVKGRALRTGIFKLPVAGRVAVNTLGLAADAQIEPRKMGQVHHAVHAYPHEHYAFWQARLALAPLPAGQFGENLTVRGLLEHEVRMGDVLRAGSAVLQVAQPRIPCGKLNARMGSRIAPDFLATGRTGYYLRVLTPGDIGAGDAVHLLERDPQSATVAEFVRVTQFDYWDAQALQALLRCRDLMPAWQEAITAKIARAQAASGWHGLRELIITQREQDAHGNVSLRLACARGQRLPPYRAGQRLGVVLNAQGGDQQRHAYVLCGHPQDTGAYRITLRADPQAPPDHLAPRLAALPVGAGLRCAAPHGPACLPDTPDATRPVVLFCSDLGWAATTSVLHELRALGARQIHVCGAPAPLEPVALRAQALATMQEMPGCTWHPWPECPTVHWGDSDILVAGPREFIAQVTTLLQARDVSPAILRVMRCDE